MTATKPELIWRKRIADTETPVSAALKLFVPERGDFILESVEGGETRGRHSLIGIAPDLVFRAAGDSAEINSQWMTDRTAFAPSPLPSLDALRALATDCRMDVPEELPPALACQPLYAEPFLACLPQGHPEARRRRVPLAALADQPFILFSRKGSPDYHARIVDICRQHGFTPRLQHEGRHWLSVVSLVAQGLGVSIVPAAFERAGIQGAVFRPLAETPEPSAVFAAWRRDAGLWQHANEGIILAAAGLPKDSASGPSLLNGSMPLGTSQFMEQARYNATVEEELSQSIRRINSIKDARVHLALPRQSAFVRDRADPKASVIVTPYAGRAVSDGQVQAIIHLVSSSIPSPVTT